MKVFLGIAGACAALCANPAMAQDGDVSTGGLYAGPVVGVDDLDTGRADGESLGIVYGGVVGYDFNSTGAVFGVEGEVTDNTAHNDGSDLIVAGDSGRVSTGLDLYAGIRAGFHAGSRTLIYAKAGYTQLNVKASYTTAAGATTRVKDELDGFRFGVGAEFSLSPNMALRTEYRYSDYGSVDNVGNPNLDFGIDRQQGVASLLFKF